MMNQTPIRSPIKAQIENAMSSSRKVLIISGWPAKVLVLWSLPPTTGFSKRVLVLALNILLIRIVHFFVNMWEEKKNMQKSITSVAASTCVITNVSNLVSFPIADTKTGERLPSQLFLLTSPLFRCYTTVFTFFPPCFFFPFSNMKLSFMNGSLEYVLFRSVFWPSWAAWHEILFHLLLFENKVFLG